MERIYKKSILICFLLIVTLGSAFALPNHTNEFYVNDFANVFDEDTKNYIFSNSKVLDEKTGAQIVIATVESMEGSNIEQYSLNLFREWGVGQKDKNNGLLILLAPNERKIKIEVGYGLEGAINDAKAGRLLDKYAVPRFKDNDWNSGIKDLYMSLLVEVYKEYNIDMPEDIPKEFVNNEVEKGPIDYIALYGVIGVIIILFMMFKGNGGDGRNGGTGPPFIGGYYGGGSTFSGGGGSFGGGGGGAGGGGASRGF